MPSPDGRPPLLEPGPLSPRLASYTIDARLDAAGKEIQGHELLRWKHDGIEPVAELPFHLYMNAFQGEDTVFMREARGQFPRGRPSGHWGGITVSSIRLAAAELRPQARFGEDQTTLFVPLPHPVAPGEEVALEIEWTTRLPEVIERTGYVGDFLMVGQWFPKIGVLAVEDGKQVWHCDTFHANSEFFADFGEYRVTLTVPETHVVAATGVLVEARPLVGGLRTLTFAAEDVHDFAWMAAPDMRILSGRAGAVEVRVYHRPGQEAFARRHLEAARRTVDTFGRLFRPYPYALLTVIDTPPDAALGAGGMEYPTLVTTGGDIDIDGLHFAEQVTVHEVGHNWFQGMLASNEVDEAWLDEGVNEYADGIVLDEWFGPASSTLSVAGLRAGYYPDHRLAVDPERLPAPITTRSYDFPSTGDYGGTTYYKTAMVLKTLEGMVGKERFLAALGLYARRNAFHHPTRRDFLAALKDGLGDYSWFLEPALNGPGGVRFRVARLRPHGEGAEAVSEITVENLGHVPASVEIELVFADGKRERRTWDGRGTFHRFDVPGKPVVEVTMDPDGKVLLQHDLVESSYRKGGSARASLRAAARAGFWEQNILQLVGP